MYHFKPNRTIRDDVEDAVADGMIDKDTLITAMLQYMSIDDVKVMLHQNEIKLNFSDEEE